MIEKKDMREKTMINRRMIDKKRYERQNNKQKSDKLERQIKQQWKILGYTQFINTR